MPHGPGPLRLPVPDSFPPGPTQPGQPPQGGDTGGGVQTLGDLLSGLYAQGTPDAEGSADALLADFYLWALTAGLDADPNDPQQSAGYLAARAADAEQQTAAAGRTQFPSEAALDFATADLRRGQLRELVVNALLNAAPLAVGPEQEFFPGFEPGGAAQELASLLGVGVPMDPIQRITLPISDISAIGQ